MTAGGARPGSGRKKKAEAEGPARRRGRPTNAERDARLLAETEHLAKVTGNGEKLAALVAAHAALPPARRRAAPPAAAPPAGEPVKTVVIKAPAFTPEMAPDVTPKDYFLALMRDPNVSAERRDRAAQVAIAYVDAKPGEKKLGKKEQLALEATELSEDGGVFATGAPPTSAAPRH